jgi:hypothetical protein
MMMHRKKRTPAVKPMTPDRSDTGPPYRPYGDTNPAVLDESYEVPGQLELDFSTGDDG